MPNKKSNQIIIEAFKKEDSKDYIDVIQRAFEPVAETLNMTKENFPASGAFFSQGDLNNLLDKESYVYGLYHVDDEERLIGTVIITSKDKRKFKIEKLTVLPAYRHMGYGKELMTFAESFIHKKGGKKAHLGLVLENDQLLKWYESLGYTIKKKKTYKNSSFTIVFMEKKLEHLQLKSKTLIWLLSHEREQFRPTNTGKLIKKTLPNHTEVSYWRRVEPNEDLLSIINDETYEPILVFPVEGADHRRLPLDDLRIKTDKTRVFIILDGIWKESKKILRQSPYLQDLPFVALENLEKTRYTLRRNKELDHICTVEVAIELLKELGENEAVTRLDEAFEYFINNYNKSTQV